MKDILNKYDFINPITTFVRHGENKVYKLEDGDNQFILRIHEPIEGFSLALHQRDYSYIEYIESEMKILFLLSDNKDFKVQTPIKNKNGDLVTCMDDGRIITVLTWLEGHTVSDLERTDELAFQLGETLAKIHNQFFKLESNIDLHDKSSHRFKRYYYDQDTVFNLRKDFDEAFKMNHITKHHCDLINKVLDEVIVVIKEQNKLPNNTRLVHSDLGLSNLIISKDVISPIDFSLCGYGSYIMDISSMCANFKETTHRRKVVQGYESITNEKVDVKVLGTYFALGVLLYVGCQHNRLYKEEWFHSAMERWEREILVPLLSKEDYVLG